MLNLQNKTLILIIFFASINTFTVCADAPKPTTAQNMLDATARSFGSMSWSVSGNSHLEYTRSVIDLLDTKGTKEMFLAHCLIDELETNPVINDDYAFMPVTTSHEILERDLSLVSSSSTHPQHSIIHFLGIAQSVPAKISLGFLLTSPQTDIGLLHMRQDALKAIIHNEGLLSKSEKLVQAIAKNQRELTLITSSRWIDGWGKPNGQGSFSIFDLPVINKVGHSVPGKSLQYYIELIGGKAAYAARITFVVCALIYLAKKMNISLPNWIAEFQKTNQNAIAIDGRGIITDGDQRFLSLLPAKYNFLKRLHGSKGFDVVIILYLLVQLKVILEETEWQQATIIQALFFTKVTTTAAKTLTKIKDIYTTTKGCKELRQLPDLKRFYDFFEKNLVHNKDLAKIFSLAKSSHMNYTYSPVKPAVLQYFFELVKENRDAINALLLAYGRLEVYLGCAGLYKKQSKSTNQFCFAEYIKSQVPLYQATNLWNPLLAPEKAVGSDIDFGESSGKRIYIVTGANEGGKSVFLKAVPLGALFAQTVGIVPAISCRIAPFEIIETYLNITDNIAQGHSLFRAEAVRARELLDRISTSQETNAKRALIVFDELFNGTSPKEATSLAYGVAEYIEKQKNVCGVFSTHFPFIATLEKTCPAIQNRCVTMYQDNDGIWRSTYSVEPGVSDQHIALDILAREGVTGSIMETAQNVLQKLN